MKPSIYLHPIGFVALLAVTSMFVGCGEEDNGGDHIPDDKVYPVASLPAHGQASELSRQEMEAPFLRRFVRLASRYDICLATSAFDDLSLTLLQDRLARRSGTVATFGLEAVVNHALATVDQFNSGAKAAVGRIEINLVRPEQGTCHLLITRAASQEFPFNHEDFAGQQHVLLETNQMREDQTLATNRVPVAFVDQSLSGGDLELAAQYLIGRFLGLGESQLAGSYLSHQTKAVTSGAGYLVETIAGRPRLDDDAQILYGFALVFRDVIKTRDLDTFHHHQDELLPSDAEQDPDLVMPPTAQPLAFSERVGDLHLYGVRHVGASLPVCFVNVSGVDIAAEHYATYLDFVAPDAAGSVIALLAAREPRITTRATVVTAGCSLLVLLKNGEQFPFATRSINGLYASEGSLEDAAGAKTTLPVIYLNTSVLEVDPTAAGSGAKPLALVLQHEFAHFLGMKHSPSSSSILSPAGYNPSWDEAGGDGAILDAFAAAWGEAN